MVKTSNSKKLYSSGEVADELGLKYFQLDYLIRTGQVKTPNSIGGRRIFTKTDIKNISKVLNKKNKKVNK